MSDNIGNACAERVAILERERYRTRANGGLGSVAFNALRHVDPH
jgi:hypothetical protein